MEAHNTRQLCFLMGWLEGGGAEKLRCEYSVAVSTGALPLKLYGEQPGSKKQAASCENQNKKKGKSMGRKRKFSKLLLFAAMLSTIGAGVLGSVPLPVKAAEEEGTYTVRFEAYEGTCETESVSVPRGESIILPGASYEGHYLESWMDVTESGNVHTFKAVGTAGSEYTPERDLWLYANWKPDEDQKPGQDITVTYEARIGDTGYEELEEAFADAQAGDTITVLKDCRVSATLEVTADNITLKSEDAGNPVTISREEGFSGKNYGTNTDTVLLAVTGGSLTTQDIIFDGGAVLDGDFNNSGKVWNGPLIYVDGVYTMERGTVLQNNYNTDGYESDGSGRPLHTAGALHIVHGGSLTMDGGLLQDCYTAGAGGGIQSGQDSQVTAASILLDEDFESASTFVLGGYDSIKLGRVLIDGTLYHKDANPEAQGSGRIRAGNVTGLPVRWKISSGMKSTPEPWYSLRQSWIW